MFAKLYYAFLIALVCIAGLLAYLSASQIHYIPFVGNIQYLCTAAGTEYMLIKDTIMVHIKPDGLPKQCTPSRFAL